MTLFVVALLVTLVEPVDAERPTRSSVVLTFASYSSAPDTIGFGSDARIHIEGIWIALQDVQVRAASSCKRATAKSVVAGPVTAELVKRQTTGTNKGRVEVGQYCAFEFQLRRARGTTTGAPSELRGASIVIVGRRADGARFVLRSRLDAAPLLRARELEGFSVSEARTDWILGVDVSRWMAGIDLSIADAGEGQNREVRIDDKSNADLLATFNGNVEAGFGLFEDRDGDRNLSAAERAQPIATRQ